METLISVNSIIGLLMAICFFYQWLYVFISFAKPKKFADAPPSRYAILISARNEEKVIANLIKSIKLQNYPSNLIDVYVVADNCTDNTASVAKSAGANVIERFNTEKIGKGHALNFLVHHIWDTVGQGVYKGYIIFDADNLLEPNFVHEMNKAVASGYRLITSYINAKNFSKNWISACSGTWHMRTSVQFNRARMMLGISNTMIGTGIFVDESIVIEDGGFISKTLTEDIELSYRWIAKGEKIGFCNDAIFYDEQPTSFKSSFHQRVRWFKGSLSNYLLHGPKLLAGCFKKRALSCLDVLLLVIPFALITIAAIGLNVGIGIDLIARGKFDSLGALSLLLKGLISGYFFAFFMAFFVMLTERKRIVCPWWKRILYCFIFPIHTASYALVVLYGLFSKSKWKPIEHNDDTTIENFLDKGNK